jgi:hypothetical protein
MSDVCSERAGSIPALEKTSVWWRYKKQLPEFFLFSLVAI